MMTIGPHECCDVSVAFLSSHRPVLPQVNERGESAASTDQAVEMQDFRKENAPIIVKEFRECTTS